MPERRNLKGVNRANGGPPPNGKGPAFFGPLPYSGSPFVMRAPAGAIWHSPGGGRGPDKKREWAGGAGFMT